MDIPCFILMDVAFSKTAIPGLVLFTWLISIRDINMTSGVSFGFKPEVKEKLFSDMSMESFKKGRKLNNRDLFILTRKESKLYGLNIFRM